MIARFVLPVHAPVVVLITFYVAVILWIATLVHSAQRRNWGWFVVALLLPGIGVIAYWVWFAMTDRPAV